MKKIILVSLMLMLLTGCNWRKADFSFIDFGVADKNNFIAASDSRSVSWVEDKWTEANNQKSLISTVFVADNDGANKKTIYSQSFLSDSEGKAQGLTLLGYFPATKVVVFGVKDAKSSFGTPSYNQVTWKFIDSQEVKSLSDDFVKFINSSKGVIGYRIGHGVSYYQLSVDNYFVVDSVLNYEPDKVKAEKCMFSDLRTNDDNSRLVYLFACADQTQKTDNRIISSNLEGNDRKQVVESKDDLVIMGISGNKVKYKENNQDKESEF